MFFLGFRRKWTALALCKSIESALHYTVVSDTPYNYLIYLSGARVSIFLTLLHRLQKGILANTEGVQVLHGSLRLKQSSEKKIQFYPDIKTCDHFICTINHPMFIIFYHVEESISIQRALRVTDKSI